MDEFCRGAGDAILRFYILLLPFDDALVEGWVGATPGSDQVSLLLKLLKI